ncbi:MAG: MBL fold metallo-hydrolase [Tenuifilum sp.]|uniref:MBL fold metallo-hydrolase n=1 Tax=Tenuifilum sp. TaxID=2760880 RepID=UPI001B784FBE|nr:MBL fold metallo-hydrolase [Bacteroidales bacterium]HOK60851.1 MBL fold metallo-hydrolase [Tenuifilum sp.]MBP9029407.1 MBL fold metallo-hydrolase [Bacteroidales bacterium]HOK85577.1 MBL fold metallo-hydrolase [Tenuifilum sp.]HON70348.1 MBL fold metallo-hydrolase [Tenuifilum sp.]
MNTQVSKNIEAVAESIQWFGQAAVKIMNCGKVIYIDPYQIKGNDKADLILITHSHFDHFSPDDIKKIVATHTWILCPSDVADEAQKFGAAKVIAVQPGFNDEWHGIEIKTVPMYNLTKTDKHPKSKNWVGYLLNLCHVWLYHTGDTERIPEMKSIKTDIILLPLGQTYTMNSVDDAVAAVLDTGASVAIPIHFGMYEGTTADVDKFKELLKDKVEVIVLPKS